MSGLFRATVVLSLLVSVSPASAQSSSSAQAPAQPLDPKSALLAALPAAAPGWVADRGAPAMDSLIATQEAKLVASDAAPLDRFGFTVAVSGDTAVVGATRDNHNGIIDAGAAYVFVRSGTTWSQQFKVTAADGQAFDNFGCAVALSGDTLVVGSYLDDNPGGNDAGAAYVFVRSGVTWSQQAKLLAPDSTDNSEFGYSVGLSGDTALVGAFGQPVGGGLDTGAAYVFVRDGTAWSLQSELTASDAAAGDKFGFAATLSGDTAVVGAFANDNAGVTNAGAVYVFVRNGTDWSEQAKLTASDGATNDYLGWSVALSGDTVVAGASQDDNAGGVNAGSACVFVRSGTRWDQEARLIAGDAAPECAFGWSVAVDGDTAVVGAALDSHTIGHAAGSAYVFTRSRGAWSQDTKVLASDEAANDEFGFASALSGDTAIISGVANDNTGGADAGSAYVFRLHGPTPTWTDLGLGLAGVSGVPALAGTDTLQSGSPGTLTLGNSAVSSLAMLFVSFASTPVPFKGGTLVPFPFALLVVLGTDGTGALPLGWDAWPAGFPSGSLLFFQYALQDAAGPFGVAMSNALQASTP